MLGLFVSPQPWRPLILHGLHSSALSRMSCVGSTWCVAFRLAASLCDKVPPGLSVSPVPFHFLMSI